MKRITFRLVGTFENVAVIIDAESEEAARELLVTLIGRGRAAKAYVSS